MLEDLIKNAEKLKEKQVEKLFEVKVARFEEIGIKGNVKIRKPDTSLLASFAERNNDTIYLLSESIVQPDLNNKDLQTVFGVKNKKDLVKKLFNSQELSDLDIALGKIVRGTRAATLVDDIKN